MNRLADSTSPYLRQHQENPVDWYPWGEEAFAEARRRDVPVLLSVGYSACHWCHVMAHESFEDPETAEVVNQLFVNVKVDREERPDVDAVYMDAVQAMTGHGGWPMTVFLTPDGRPFFGGTYFPKESRAGMPGFVTLCRAVDDAWRTRREEILEQAGRMTEALRQSALLTGKSPLPGAEVLDAAADALRAQFDGEWGGFGRAPKFPQTMAHELLLRVHHRRADDAVLDVVTTSLDAMASGGIYDHVGGGFARYSVDTFWMVPHFEKMLYDQALLARVYLHAWQVTGEQRYRQVLDETVGYVLRDLRSPGGGCYSAEDADSEGEEGKFYVWRPEEIRRVCGDDAEAAIEWYGVTTGGNFEGANILHRPVRGDLARPPAVERARRALFEARQHRVRPGLDDKVLAEWNGLFLATLAEAAAATGDADWRAAASTLGAFLLGHLRRDDGRWLRSWHPDLDHRPADEVGPRPLAYAADHAALIDGFTRLAECTGEAGWMDEARATADALLDRFWDDEQGGLFTTGDDAEPLVARQKDVFDGASPSANGSAAQALARLAALTGEAHYQEAAEDIVRLLAEPATAHPTAFTHLLGAVDLLVGPVAEVAVVGERPDLVGAVQHRFLPRTVLAWGEPYPSPLWEGRTEGRAYVCEDFACKEPVESVDALLAQLQS
ncbi:MAG TPA: thioredoxin domain-containing protein [Acidimicrobiales bacterium]|nr:thioredoxin domain-containing protein [Acidimicrobiales bacterium]